MQVAPSSCISSEIEEIFLLTAKPHFYTLSPMKNTCKQCGKTFIPENKSRGGKFCSLSCSNKFNSPARLKKMLSDPSFYKKSKKGGITRGKQMKEIGELARQNYLKNPKLCLNCKKPIPLKKDYPPSFVRKRRFCGYECSAQHRVKKYWQGKVKKRGKTRGDRKSPIGLLTKQQLIDRFDGNIRRASANITNHARFVYMKSGKPYICAVCGYKDHVEIAHMNAISDFSGDALIEEEINHISNLAALCRNHHWEYDHGHITRDQLTRLSKNL